MLNSIQEHDEENDITAYNHINGYDNIDNGSIAGNSLNNSSTKSKSLTKLLKDNQNFEEVRNFLFHSSITV